MIAMNMIVPNTAPTTAPTLALLAAATAMKIENRYTWS